MYEKARVKFEIPQIKAETGILYGKKIKIKELSLFDLKGLGQNVF